LNPTMKIAALFALSFTLVSTGQLTDTLLSEGLLSMGANGQPTVHCLSFNRTHPTPALTACTAPESFDGVPSSVGCFSVFREDRVLAQGCLAQQDISFTQCTKGRCVGKALKSGIYFCCCHGTACNGDLSEF
ncbi:hypothetical protein PMAYCL1PPCAC_28642, partial [Pristionchus mayeri]